MPAPEPGSSRLAYIDWMRGLACLLMFQTHCYDSWLSAGARQSRFFMYSQLGGTFPAPLFLFLAGVSSALVTEKLWEKSLSPVQIASRTIRRGAEIFALGLLFRLQEFVLAMGWSPWTDLLRVDILNTIGLSMMLMGGVCWLVLSAVGRTESGSRTRLALVAASSLTAALISLLTPPLWTTWGPRWLPWPLESYINGVHNLGAPQSWLFPIFPWSAFAFAGLAVGFVLQSPWVRGREARIFFAVGAGGVAMVEAARWVNARPWHVYAVYDFWHTSPAFSDPAGHADGDSFSELRVVQVGRGTVGIQSADSVGASFAAGLLGAHGIRVRAAFHSAQAWRGDWCGDGGAGGDLRGDGGVGRVAYAEEEASSSCARQNARKPLR